MKQRPDQGLEQVLATWLREGSVGLPHRDEVLQDVRRRLPSTPRRRVPWWAWRRAATTQRDWSGVQPTTRFVWRPSSVTVAAGLAVIVIGVMLVTLRMDRPAVPALGARSEAPGLPPVTGPTGNGLIAFSRDGDIFVGDPATGVSEALVARPETDTAPVFSPDGRHIAFWRILRPADERQHGEAQIIVVRADGSAERIVNGPDATSAPNPGGFVWTPDGRSLVLTHVVGVPGPKMALSLLDAAGLEAARDLAGPLPGPYGFGGAQVAWFLRPPSGDRLLVADWGVGPILTVRDLDGSDVLDLGELAGLEEARRRLAAGTSYPPYQGVRDAAWSPDASRIAFLASANSDAYSDHLYVMNADGSDLRLLNDQGGDFAWSPDGSHIAYERSVWEPGAIPSDPYVGVMVILDVGTGAERVLDATTSPAVESPTGRAGPFQGWAWSPDGQSILYLPTASARAFTVDIDTGEASELPWESDSVPSWQRVAAG